MRVKDIMDASPNLLRTSDNFEHLIKTLDKVKYRVVFVVDKDDKLVGVVTEADLVKVLIPKYLSMDELLIPAMDENYFEKKCLENRNLAIAEIMTKTILSVHEDDTVIKAAALMVVHKIRTLPVVRDSEVVGIVHLINLIRYMMNILTRD